MSNLKLPVMSYGNLTRLVGNRYAKTIAHNTTATAYEGYVEIRYHGNLIAEVWQGGVYLSTAGWATQTTLARLRAVLRDNLPNLPISVRIKDFTPVVVKSGEFVPFRDVIIYDNGDTNLTTAYPSANERAQK
jgi:hypothetical protein